MFNEIWIKEKLKEFINEDLLYYDLTSLNLPDYKVEAKIYFKEKYGVICGIPFLNILWEMFEIEDFKWFVKEGEEISKGEISYLKGKARKILAIERVSLNILGKLSGIATLTRKFVKKIKDKNIHLLDTRKTTPGFRFFEKYAVKVGGGKNHRIGLFDMILIKDNHIKLMGGLKRTVEIIKRNSPPYYKVEVEVKNFKELKEAIESEVDIIMLDNFKIEEIKKAVEIIRNKKPEIKIEISGGIREENIEEFTKFDINFISSSAIINSARWLDFSLKLERRC